MVTLSFNIVLPVHFQLATPIQAIQLTSVNRELNTDKGIVSYDVILKADQLFYHKTSIDFSLPDRKCDIRLYKSEGVFLIFRYYDVHET